jgi:hypothetical protein
MELSKFSERKICKILTIPQNAFSVVIWVLSYFVWVLTFSKQKKIRKHESDLRI